MTQTRYQLLLVGLLLAVPASAARSDDAGKPDQNRQPCCFEDDDPRCFIGCPPEDRPATSAQPRSCCAQRPTACCKSKLVTRTYSVGELITPTTGTAWTCSSCTPEEWLTRLVCRVVAPHAWSEMGGMGTIEYYPLGKALVVRQSPEIHEQIDELLTALRRLRPDAVPHAITGKESFASVVPPPPAPVALPPAPGMSRFLVECPLPRPTAPFAVVQYTLTSRPLPAGDGPCPLTVHTGTPQPSCTVAPCVAECKSATTSRSRVFKAVAEYGKPLLCIDSPGDLSAFCTSIAVRMSNGETISLSTHKKQILVRGPEFEASANHVDLSDARDRLNLEGDVTVRCQQNGRTVSITGAKVTMRIGNGCFEINAPGNK